MRPVVRPEAHINLLRRTAQHTQGNGMGATVPGEQIRAVIGALDEARARVVELESAAYPVSERADGDTACVDILVALNGVLVGKADLWGEPIDAVLTAWCVQQERPMPPEWKRLIAAVVG